MNDWMTLDKAWLHMLNRRTPIEGVVVHSANHSNTHAWFVPDDGTVTDGVDVPDEEGVADDGGVWYKHKASRETALYAFKVHWEAELDKAKNDVRYYENRLKDLEYDNGNEAGAE